MYAELPSPRSIRVLSFEPRTLSSNKDRRTRPRDGVNNEWSGAMHCQLLVTELTDLESYDALSYVWGDPNVREHLLVCNGHPVKITANLWSALQDIWTKWPEKRLWVDAICINQENIPERNHQVGMMGDIYSTAKEVIVWVGGHTPLSKDLFKAARLIEAKKDLSLASWDVTKKDRMEEDSNDGKREFLNYLSNCGDDIANRPWFVRAWTLQEIKLATDAIICCGNDTANFGLFLETIYRINCLHTFMDICGGRMVRIPTFYDVHDSNFKTLYRVLATTQQRQATDPRDKIYSIMSLLSKDLYGFMKPDYSLSFEDTFAWACRICIKVDNEMNVLAGAGLASKRSGNLPSWVTDWREYHSGIFDYQNLSRSLSRVVGDKEACRKRNELGSKLDRTSREIAIGGMAFGRFVLEDGSRFVFLEILPECATGSLLRPKTSDGLDLFRFCCGMRPRKAPAAEVELSSEEFTRLFHDIRSHDEKQCTCTKGILRRKYLLNDMPHGLKNKDWVWTTGISKMQEEENDDEGDDEIHHFHYALRPIDAKGEAKFQLVGKTNGFSEAWDDEDVDESDAGTERSFIQIQTDFHLV
ncbi:hypothetical protein FHL15_009020 [Xylaria flabelliformis]|uniref:Heterokaryon incompatibility domain-containing protein n=1 Tax=Xylaria flabelliformis TaxID=2512241 RepID=A0A553HQ68_9PEZI|nr:hypothetical protein FHL15_009020 [Xylaria flabelliformis]